MEHNTRLRVQPPPRYFPSFSLSEFKSALNADLEDLEKNTAKEKTAGPQKGKTESEKPLLAARRRLKKKGLDVRTVR